MFTLMLQQCGDQLKTSKKATKKKATSKNRRKAHQNELTMSEHGLKSQAVSRTFTMTNTSQYTVDEVMYRERDRDLMLDYPMTVETYKGERSPLRRDRSSSEYSSRRYRSKSDNTRRSQSRRSHNNASKNSSPARVTLDRSRNVQYND